MKYPCYTTRTGIKIGCMYQRPVRQLSHDEVLIQSALLGIKHNVQPWWVALVCFGIVLSLMWITK